MSANLRLYAALERVLGRKFLWRLGRFLYLGARRELSAAIETDGEADLQDWVVAHLAAERRGGVVLDVGANLGDWSLGLARKLADAGVGGSRIMSFEPAPAQREELLRRIGDVAPGTMVTVSDKALGAEPGVARFEVTGPRSGSSSIVAGGAQRSAASEIIEVGVITIDAFLEAEGVDRVDLMKIDTEGNDFNVIKGAQGAIAAGRIDVIQFEYGFRWLSFGHTLRDVIAFATRHGLRFGRLIPGAVEQYTEWHPELERFTLANFVLLGRDAPATIKVVPMRFDVSNVAVAA